MFDFNISTDLVGEHFVSFGPDLVLVGRAQVGPVQTFGRQGQEIFREVGKLGLPEKILIVIKLFYHGTYILNGNLVRAHSWRKKSLIGEKSICDSFISISYYHLMLSRSTGNSQDPRNS